MKKLVLKQYSCNCLFLKEEEEAESIASQLTDWIETYKKEKDDELKARS